MADNSKLIAVFGQKGELDGFVLVENAKVTFDFIAAKSLLKDSQSQIDIEPLSFQRNSHSKAESADRSSPDYPAAVIQELDRRGFVVAEIQGWQKKFLVELNSSIFDKVRQQVLGDFLVMDQPTVEEFFEQLRELVKLLDEYDQNEYSRLKMIDQRIQEFVKKNP